MDQSVQGFPSLASLPVDMHGPSASEPTPALTADDASPPRTTRVLSIRLTAVAAFAAPWRKSASAHSRSFNVAMSTGAGPYPPYCAVGSIMPDSSYRICAMFDW